MTRKKKSEGRMSDAMGRQGQVTQANPGRPPENIPEGLSFRMERNCEGWCSICKRGPIRSAVRIEAENAEGRFFFRFCTRCVRRMAKVLPWR